MQTLMLACVLGVAAGSLPFAEADEHDPAQEAVQLRQQQEQIYNAMNANNPFAAGTPPGSAGQIGRFPAGVLGGTGTSEAIDRMNKILANPMIQRYMKLYSNPAFLNSVTELEKSPNRMNLLYAEIGSVIFLFLFRAWRSTKVRTVLGAVWLKVWTLGLFFIVTGLVLPVFLLGQPYADCLSAIFKVFSGNA